MKMTIRLLAVCLMVTVGAGCAQTSVMLGKDGVSVATEGPVFLYSMTHLRNKAIRAAVDALEACESTSTKEPPREVMQGKSVADLKAAFDVAKTTASLIPMRSFTLTLDVANLCPKVKLPSSEGE